MAHVTKMVKIVVDLNPEEPSHDPAYKAVVWLHREGEGPWIKPSRIEVRDRLHAMSYVNGINEGRSQCGFEDLPIEFRS